MFKCNKCIVWLSLKIVIIIIWNKFVLQVKIFWLELLYRSTLKKTFKRKEKDPVQLIIDFYTYMKTVNKFYIATGKERADESTKLALLKAIGGGQAVQCSLYSDLHFWRHQFGWISIIVLIKVWLPRYVLSDNFTRNIIKEDNLLFLGLIKMMNNLHSY